MSKMIVIGIADFKVAKSDEILITYALGSCVGICLHDPIKKIAGLVHIMLPESSQIPGNTQPLKFADTGIQLLIKKMEEAGAIRRQLRAKIAGGATMFAATQNTSIANIGQRNVFATKQTLMQLRIPIAAEDTGKNFGRTQVFDAQTGTMLIKSATRGEWSL